MGVESGFSGAWGYRVSEVRHPGTRRVASVGGARFLGGKALNPAMSPFAPDFATAHVIPEAVGPHDVKHELADIALSGASQDEANRDYL